MRGRHLKDRIGQRFTFLTVIGVASPEYRQGTVIVRCDCGVEKYIHISNLTDPKGTKSCGCKKLLDYQKRNSGLDKDVIDGRITSKRKYQCFHKRLTVRYGSANKCEVCDVKGKSRYEYALKKGHEYSDNPSDYIQMCVSCHRKYDYNEETSKKISAKTKGVARPYISERQTGVRLPHLWVPIVQKSKDGTTIKEYPSPTIANIETKITRTGIMNVLAGRAETSGGYKWEYKQ